MYELELRFRTLASTLRVGFGLLALVFLLVVQSQAQTRPQPPVPLPTPFTPIVDYANVIDADTRQRLESIYLNLKDRGGIVYSVLTVQTTGEQDIFDYSLAVARGWGIGPKDAENPSFTFPHVPRRHGKIIENLGCVDSEYQSIDQGPIVAMIEN